jgi:hypothetical protein
MSLEVPSALLLCIVNTNLTSIRDCFSQQNLFHLELSFRFFFIQHPAMIPLSDSAGATLYKVSLLWFFLFAIPFLSVSFLRFPEPLPYWIHVQCYWECVVSGFSPWCYVEWHLPHRVRVYPIPPIAFPVSPFVPTWVDSRFAVWADILQILREE